MNRNLWTAACLSALGVLGGVGLAAWAQTPPAPAAPVTDATPLASIAKAPSATISNGLIKAKLYLPDADKGFYRGVRFDWAGMISSLTYKGHDFYTPWFASRSPAVRDYIFQDGKIIAGPQTAAVGPVEEFNGDGGALGYADAKPGGVFLKIGVGVVRRPDAAAYSSYLSYPLVDAGKRTNRVGKDNAVFTQDVSDPGSGYAYSYVKTVRLVKGSPVMIIEHELKNTGSRPIASTVFDHNFLNIDGKGTEKDLQLTAPFDLVATPAPAADLAQTSGKSFLYKQAPPGEQHVQTAFKGYGATSADYDFSLFDPNRQAGLRIRADQPMDRLALWSIRPVMAIEPFVRMNIKPGETFRWSYWYDYRAGAAG